MPYGLSDSVIEEIRGVFSRFPQVKKVILYGSRAKGNYKRGSDIDLTLAGEELDLKILGQIEDRLDDLMLPYSLDLSLLNRIDNQELLEHIARVGIEF